MYFMISTSSFMFYMGSRKDGVLSAYSVFNPGGIRLLDSWMRQTSKMKLAS